MTKEVLPKIKPLVVHFPGKVRRGLFGRYQVEVDVDMVGGTMTYSGPAADSRKKAIIAWNRQQRRAK